MHYVIEKINADNWRPGMPKEGYLVRYNPHNTYGWLCLHVEKTKEKAEEYAAGLPKCNSDCESCSVDLEDDPPCNVATFPIE